MVTLTQKQEDFCLAYVELKCATDAYKKVYKTDNMKTATIHRCAFDMMENPKIAARIADIRNEAREKAGLTLVDHLKELEGLREAAKLVGNLPAAINAEIARGKASGLYDKDSKVDVAGGISISIDYGDSDGDSD